MENALQSPPACSYHAVRFYENEKSLAQIVAEFVNAGLREDMPAIIAAAPSQRGAIIRELVVRGVDVVSLQRSADLVLLDARETLSLFIRDGKLDANAFMEVMSGVIEAACRGRANCAIRIYGQMVDVLWQEGHCDLAISLEMLWNQLANTHAFSLLCGYAMGSFYKDGHFADICGQHTHIVSADGAAAGIVGTNAVQKTSGPAL
jgi:DcmR-like sensory protein